MQKGHKGSKSITLHKSLTPQTVIQRFHTPVIINGVADSYKTKVDEDGYQPSNLICISLELESILFGIGLVCGNMLKCITICMVNNTVYQLNGKK